ncbi:hypothetical protein ACLKMY_33610 [Paraburkholderia mimosarum]
MTPVLYTAGTTVLACLETRRDAQP